MTAAPLDLRALVAELVREVVAETVTEMVGGAVRDSLGGVAGAGPAGPAGSAGSAGQAPVAPRSAVNDGPRVAGAQHVTPPELRTRSETVRLASDADLDAFVRRLLTLFENPKNRQDLKAGRLRFHLGQAPGQAASHAAGTGAAPAGAAVRVETGAVTERQVTAAAEAGKRLVLGRRAVLTPLGREKARALGVPIEKER